MSHSALARTMRGLRGLRGLSTMAFVVLVSTAFSVCGALAARVGRVDDRERERGDVPGWVLITLMTAGLVTVIWAAAGPQLEQLFTQAISSVTGPGKK